MIQNVTGMTIRKVRNFRRMINNVRNRMIMTVRNRMIMTVRNRMIMTVRNRMIMTVKKRMIKTVSSVTVDLLHLPLARLVLVHVVLDVQQVEGHRLNM